MKRKTGKNKLKKKPKNQTRKYRLVTRGGQSNTVVSNTITNPEILKLIISTRESRVKKGHIIPNIVINRNEKVADILDEVDDFLNGLQNLGKDQEIKVVKIIKMGRQPNISLQPSQRRNGDDRGQ